ncbi:hypothetical protein Trydic_g12834 [Trypoxylus dichotomus]
MQLVEERRRIGVWAKVVLSRGLSRSQAARYRWLTSTKINDMTAEILILILSFYPRGYNNTPASVVRQVREGIFLLSVLAFQRNGPKTKVCQDA